MTGGVIGTAEFMSPEQSQGQRTTKKSDLYSLGAVMYAMLTGRPPFTGKTAIEVLQKHRFNQFDAPRMILPDIRVWLDDVVCQLLEKDPDKRFPDAYVLSLRLKEIPRKVELAGMQETRTMDPCVYNADGTTIAISSRPKLGPGDGTLMRDMLRAEIDRQQQPSRVGRLLDNSWFLVAILVVLIVGGYYALQARELSPQQKFAAGEKLMQQPAGTGWMTARDQYFLPLVADDRSMWEAKVGNHLQRIQQYELELRLSPGKLKKNREPARNDAERFLRLAQHYRDIGDVGRSRSILMSLTQLLDEQGEHQLYRVQAQKMLAELDGMPQTTDNRRSILKAAMQRADEFTSTGKLEEAQMIYENVIALYGADAAVADDVRIAIEKRDELGNLKQDPPPVDD
jgi:serine/threonine-protein kinase